VAHANCLVEAVLGRTVLLRAEPYPQVLPSPLNETADAVVALRFPGVGARLPETGFGSSPV